MASKYTGDPRGRHAEVRLGITPSFCLSLSLHSLVRPWAERVSERVGGRAPPVENCGPWTFDDRRRSDCLHCLSLHRRREDKGRTLGVVLRLSFTVSP